MAEINNGLMILGICALLLVVGYTSGVLKPSGQPLIGGAVGVPTSNVVITGTGGACPSTGTVDLPFYAESSIADPTTGAKTGVQATFNVYNGGTIVPYTQAISTATGSGSTNPDLPCGTTGVFVIVNSTTGYHPKRFDITGALPFAASGALVTADLAPISSITLYGYNSSATGTQTSTTLHQTLAASTTLQNLKIEVASQGLKEVVKPMMGIKWVQDVTTDAAANSTVSVSDPNWSVAMCGLGGTGFDQYDDCFVYNGNVANGQSLFVNPQITSASNFALINATVMVVDLGEYTDTVGTLLHSAYSNPNTGARPTYSANAATIAIQFNS